MSKPDFNSLMLLVGGIILLLVNKPFAELCRQAQITLFGRDYGLRAMRIPLVIVAIILIVIGLTRFVI